MASLVSKVLHHNPFHRSSLKLFQLYSKMIANARTFQLFHEFISLLFVLLMLQKALGGNTVPIRCLERERNALLHLKQGLFDEDGQLSSWSGEECCKWQGIRCSNLTGHVLTLDLHSPYYSTLHPLRLRGNLTFSSLVELHHLTYLDLSSNDFFDRQIPESIGSLRELRYLNLSRSGFAGKIPHYQIGNLTHLQTLDLGMNDFTNVENLEWLSNLRAIRYLDLSLIDLSNTNWLQPIQNLSFLTELKLRSCGLRSPLTPLTNSSYMQTLDLSFNDKLNGDNFEWLSNLRAIRYLDLSAIDLSNTNWVQPIQKLSFLTELHLSYCLIRYPLPPLTNSSYMPLLSVIDLSDNDFNSSSQPLFHWLYNLSSSLVDVDISFSWNNLQAGPLPDVFSNMIYLQYLNLQFCNFEGMIPDSLLNLTRLQSLDLSFNSLTGNLSRVLNKWSPGAKNSIEVLRLSSNELSGPLPDFSRFSSLKVFDVSHNNLNGPFPESLGHHFNLASLDLSSNRITGPLPNPFSFPNLEYLNLSNNTLKGPLPESIGQFSKLLHLDVSTNLFEDTITEIHFMKLSKLLELELSFNSLVLDVSSDWIPPFQLDVIALRNCKLGPPFPMWLQTQTRFSMLHISHANISGAVPSWFWKLVSPSLRELDLASNQMSGVIPDLSSLFPQLRFIDLSSNQFSGPLPLIPPTVEALLLSENMFVGSISSVCDIAGIGDLDLSDNLLSGELPDCWNQIEQLNVLNLANNNFTGEIPSSLGFLNGLEYLHLRNNSFIGILPHSLKNCTRLKIVDLGGNKFSGRIPEWIGVYMNDLIILSLSQNKLYGSIPQNICNLNHIQVLDLSQNGISGYIPRCFNNFTALVEMSESAYRFGWVYVYDEVYAGRDLENVEVQWKGQRAGYGKTLPLLKVIDLSSNNLTGEIPVELVSLICLQSLNLSRNYFRGDIPEKIGEMKNLECLDLSRNLLSGQIPLGLGTVASLSVLDLSNNHLSGRIPPGTQLQGFNSSVYTGNQKLCGLPLSNNCSGDGETPTSKDKNGEDDDDDGDDKLITLGFYVSAVLGFAVGFWGVFGTLQLKHSWRRAFFQFLSYMKDKVYVAAAVNIAKIKRIRTA